MDSISSSDIDVHSSSYSSSSNITSLFSSTVISHVTSDSILNVEVYKLSLPPKLVQSSLSSIMCLTNEPDNSYLSEFL